MLPEFASERLRLHPRTERDLDAVAALNADPLVMRHIAAPGDPAMGRDGVSARSFAHVGRGLGYWSVFPRDADAAALLGYVGLIPDGEDGGQVQLSYRFAPQHWGQGFAAEAARPVIRHGFATLGLPAIGLFTHPDNAASCRLAERLGFAPLPGPAPETIGDPPVPGRRFLLSREIWRATAQADSGLNTR